MTIRFAKYKLQYRENTLKEQNLSERDFQLKVAHEVYHEMVRDVAEAAINERLSFDARYSIVHGVTWNWTQYHGKYLGNPLWSKQACDNYRKAFGSNVYTNSHMNKQTFTKFVGVTEDHVVPRSVLINHILHNPFMPNPKLVFPRKEVLANLELFLHTYLLGCILSSEETIRLNKGLKEAMPDGFYNQKETVMYRNPWARYLKQTVKGNVFPKIDVYQVRWTRLKNGVWEMNPDKEPIDFNTHFHSYVSTLPEEACWLIESETVM